jgi:cysteine desulfurase / selenocysteine lyase
MSFDLDRARRETSGCENRIHFNNAGAALMPTPVVDAMTAHIKREAEIGGYEAQAEAEAAGRLDIHGAAARFLNAGHKEIALAESATRAWDMAFYGAVAGLGLKAGDRILTCSAEYASTQIAFLQVAKRCGVEIVPVPDNETGQISLKHLEAMIDQRTRLISLTHVPTNCGLVNPAESVGEIARKAGIPYFLDACQSAGQLPLDVKAIGCDVLTFTGRKYLRAPRGTGILYVRADFLERIEPPFLDLHAAPLKTADTYEIRPDARRFESWETNIAARAGLKSALDYAMDWDVAAIAERIEKLASQLRQGLEAIPGIKIHDQGKVLCGIVGFSHTRHDPEKIRTELAREGVNIHISYPASTWTDSALRNLPPLLRASVHYYNSETEIERFLNLLEGMTGKG